MGTERLLLQLETSSPDDLDALVPQLKAHFKPRTLLLLEGPVGAGKTELVQRLMRSYGITATASPSFAIHHHYENPEGSAGIDHVDLYRLESDDDLESTGFWDLFGTNDGVVIIEWADRLNTEMLPLHWHKIRITITKKTAENSRHLQITELG